MSLKFLYKKGFHTARLDIQDKVWQAEQKRDEEARKTAELRRQIEDERAVQDLRAQMGGGGPSADTGLEWMYAGVRKSAAEKQDEDEAFLTGKKAVGEKEGKAAKVAIGADFDSNKLSSKRLVAVTGGRAAAVEALAKVGNGIGISSTNPSSSSSSYSSSSSSLSSSLSTSIVSHHVPRSEAFAVRQADPLVVMAEAEARRKQLLLSDPRVLEKIKEKLLEDQRQKQQQQQRSSTEKMEPSIISSSSGNGHKETKTSTTDGDTSSSAIGTAGVAKENDDDESALGERRHRHKHHHRRHHHRHRDDKADGEESSRHRHHHHHRRRHHRDDDDGGERSRSRSISQDDDKSTRKRSREENGGGGGEEGGGGLIVEKEEVFQLPIASAEVRTKKSRWDNPTETRLELEMVEKESVMKEESAIVEENIVSNNAFIANKDMDGLEDEDEVELEIVEGNRATKSMANSSLQFGLSGGAKTRKEGVNHLGIPDHIAKEREALFRAKQFENKRKTR